MQTRQAAAQDVVQGRWQAVVHAPRLDEFLNVEGQPVRPHEHRVHDGGGRRLTQDPCQLLGELRAIEGRQIKPVDAISALELG